MIIRANKWSSSAEIVFGWTVARPLPNNNANNPNKITLVNFGRSRMSHKKCPYRKKRKTAKLENLIKLL